MNKTLNIQDEQVAIVGDWHSNKLYAIKNLRCMIGKVKTIFHVGDFNISQTAQGMDFLETIDEILWKNEIFLYITLGNHDDYDYVDTLEFDEYGCKILSRNIRIFPRPYLFTLGKESVVSFGGSSTANLRFAIEGKNWWKAEEITHADILKVEQLPVADIVLSHEAPANIKYLDMHFEQMEEFSDSLNLERINESREKISIIMNHLQPNKLFHGHHHVKYIENKSFLNDENYSYNVKVYGLNRETHAGNVGFYNTIKKTFEFIV